MKDETLANAKVGLRFALGMLVLAALMVLVGVIGAWMDGGV